MRSRCARSGAVILLTIVIFAGTLLLPATALATDGGSLRPGFSEQDHQGFILLITDIHFDPLADASLVGKLTAAPVERWSSILEPTSQSPFSQYGSDSSYALVLSALEAAAETGLEYDLVLIPGDYLAHDLRERFEKITGGDDGFDDLIIKSELFMMTVLDQTFPGVPIVATLGNNDSICGDYQVEPGGAFLRGVADEWTRLTRSQESSGDFSLGGFFSMPHPIVPDHELIVINNIFWSTKYRNSCGAGPHHPGDAEMAWLDWTLHRIGLKGRTATLLMHIPPGMSAYSSSDCVKSCDSKIVSFLAPRYARDLLDVLRRHASALSSSFAGHTHMDNLVLIDDADGKPFMFSKITTAVSPMFGNNPAFAVLQYDRHSGLIYDEATIYLTNLSTAGENEEAQWAVEYLFSQAYGHDEMSPQTLAMLARSIKSSASIRDAFIQRYDAESQQSSSFNDSSWPAFACAQTELEAAPYARCCCKDR